MKTILKYELEEGMNVILTPKHSLPMSVESQYNKPVLYCLVDTETELVERTFEVVGTGLPIESDLHLSEYIGTVMLNNESFVLHVIHKDVHSPLK